MTFGMAFFCIWLFASLWVIAHWIQQAAVPVQCRQRRNRWVVVAERGRRCCIFAVGGAKPVQFSSLSGGRQGADSSSLAGSPPPSALNYFLRNFPTCPSMPTFQCTKLLHSVGLSNLIHACLHPFFTLFRNFHYIGSSFILLSFNSFLLYLRSNPSY